MRDPLIVADCLIGPLLRIKLQFKPFRNGLPERLLSVGT